MHARHTHVHAHLHRSGARTAERATQQKKGTWTTPLTMPASSFAKTAATDSCTAPALCHSGCGEAATASVRALATVLLFANEGKIERRGKESKKMKQADEQADKLRDPSRDAFCGGASPCKQHAYRARCRVSFSPMKKILATFSRQPPPSLSPAFTDSNPATIPAHPIGRRHESAKNGANEHRAVLRAVVSRASVGASRVVCNSLLTSISSIAHPSNLNAVRVFKNTQPPSSPLHPQPPTQVLRTLLNSHPPLTESSKTKFCVYIVHRSYRPRDILTTVSNQVTGYLHLQ
jgi:hypothetical protein